MVKSGPIPASAGASNTCLPAERVPILTAPEAYELGIRIFPETIEFLEVETGSTYKRRFGVQNLRRSSATVIFPNVIHTTKDHYLTYPHYHLKIDKGAETISDVGPGLEKTATLIYACTDSEPKNDVAKILIGEEFSIHIPIVCSPVRPVLFAPAVINFGELPSDGTPITKHLTVENRGKRPGRWEIEYMGQTRTTFSPSEGLIKPGQKETILVELIPEIEGAISETARFVGQEMAPLSVRMVGLVTKSTLQLLQPTPAAAAGCGRQLRLLDFGAVYYGTKHQRQLLLHNTGVRPICYNISWSPREPGQEVAVDLTQCHLAAFAVDKKEDEQVTGRSEPPEHCFRVEPSFGKISGKGQLLLTIDFSPRAYPPEKGFNCVYQAPPRRDYCLFLTIEPSIADIEQNLEFGKVYLGVKATSLPVMFEFQPHQAHFPEVHPGDKIRMPCQLFNRSQVLPLKFTFSDIAHFRASTRKGVLKPGEVRKMHILCKPTQIGPLWRYILLDLLGLDTVPGSGEAEHHSEDKLLVAARVRVSTYSAPITPEKRPLFVPGITPLWGHNETGLNTDAILPPCDGAPACTLAAMRSNKHRWTRWASISQEEQSFVALPNDRCGSIRPYHGPAPIRTIFTGQPRYTYLDPTYQYTADEWRYVLLNEAVYQEYLDRCRMERWLTALEEERKLYKGQQNDKLLNKTATFFLSGEFSQLMREWSTVCSRERRRLLKLKANVEGPPVPGLNKQDDDPSSDHGVLEVIEKFDEKPKSQEVRLACQRELTCVDIAKVKISNKLLNFGEVAQNVWACRILDVQNRLDWHVLFKLHVDCKELEHTTPTSAVVPPHSTVRLPVIFTCSTKREYKRVIKYSVNGTSLDSVLVVATVVRMRLDMSTTKLHFKCSNLSSISPGIYQMVVVLRNSLNGVGEYRWRQEIPDTPEYDPAVFSIKPAHGVIDPYHSQRCLVTFRPTTRVRTPHAATFACHVTGGDALTLSLTSDLAPPRFRLTDDRIQLENLPLYKVKKCTPRLYNVGLSDAFFCISDPQPCPGISVSPAGGCIPAGGSVELTITLVPISLFRFDTPIRILVRDGSTLGMMVSGRVEAPEVTSDCGSLYFGGVHCGSSASQVLHLENRSKIPAVLEFDLREHWEFSLSGVFETSQVSAVEEPVENVYTVRLDEMRAVPICVEFAPQSLANHGFMLAPLLHAPDAVRSVSAGRMGSKTTSSMADRLSKPKRGQPKRIEAVVRLPSFKVIATALKQPVILEPQTLQFQIGAELLEKCFKVTKRVRISNNLNRAIKVVINARSNDCFQVGPRGENAPQRGIIERQLEVDEEMKLPITFTTSFLYPTHPTIVRAHLPVYVDQLDQPATTLDILADCAPTHITTTPRTLFMGAVPLGMMVSSDLQIVCHDYQQADELSVSLSYVEYHPTGHDPPNVTWRFTTSNRVLAGKSSQALPLVVNFVSAMPVSVSARLQISDKSGRTAAVVVQACADNSLLTTYSFISLRPEGYQNWLEGAMPPTAPSGSQENGDSCRRPAAVISTTSCVTPPAAGGAVSVILPPNEAKDQAITSISTMSSEQVDMDQMQMDIVLPTGSTTEFPRFPTGGAIEEFYQATYVAIQTWFQNFGFPQGPFPYELYKHLPECMGHNDNSHGSFNKEDKAQTQMWQTLADSAAYLSNKKIPNMSTEDEEVPLDEKGMVLVYIKRNRVILDFLKEEGALLTHVRPEFLLRYDDFQVLLEVVKEVQESMSVSNVDMEVNEDTIEAGFSARNLNSKTSTPLLSSTAATLNDVAQHLLDPNIILVYSAFRDAKQFRDMSKVAWMDVLLQMFRRFILQTVVKLPTSTQWPEMSESDARYMPCDIDPMESNVYSVPERLLLTWMTWSYNSQMRQLWDPETNEERTITNFDVDLDDGVVLCSLFASYCPFLRDHLRTEVYARPSTPEQSFHNCVIVAETCALLNLDTRLDPSAVMDANPVAMILLTTMLYEKLPLYWPRDAIQFRPELGSSQARQLSMKNMGGRPVTYEVKMLGAERGVFQVQGGPEINISARKTLEVTVRCSVHRIKQYSATLLLCPKCSVTPRPRPLVYPLAGGPLGTSAPVTVDVVSPLYSCREVMVEVPNPLKEAGEFTARLTDKPQGDQDLDTWLRSGVDAFPVIAVDTVSLKAKGRSRVTVTHMPWMAKCRDYYALFSNQELGDFIVCFRSAPSDPLPFADIYPMHGWIGRVVLGLKGGPVCVEPSAGAIPLVRTTVQLADRIVQVGCRDLPRQELEAAIQQAGPSPENLSAFWVLDVDEILCAHCHLVVDLGPKLRDFLQQCAPQWQSAGERERRQLNGTLVSSDMIQQFQIAKYVHTPRIQGSAGKRTPTVELPEAPEGRVTYQVFTRNKEIMVAPRVLNVDGTAGPKSVPLCINFTAKTAGWLATDLVLRSPKFSDLITSRIAILVRRPKRN